MSTIADRIRKLLSLATSDNVNEAAAAAAEAQRLMSMHGIEAATLSDTPVDPVERRSVTCDDSAALWYHTLAAAVAAACFCEAYRSGKYSDACAVFIGRRGDVEAAMLLLEWLRIQVKQACQKASYTRDMRVNLKTWRNSFLAGAASEIYKRLRQSATTVVNVSQNESCAHSEALTVQQSAGLAKYRQSSQQAIADFKRQNGVRTVTTQSKSRINSDAYSAGRVAGSQVGLKAPSRALTAGR